MKWSIVVLIVLGLLAALGAAVLLATLKIGGGDNGAEKIDPEVTYLITSHDLPAMKVVEADDVVAQTTLLSELPENAIRSPIGVIGKVLTMAMVEGQVFTLGDFASDGSGVHLASALPEGMRAMSVSVPMHAGLDGILYPGSQVDVIATMQLPTAGAARGDYVSTTLLQNVQVLAIEDKSIVDEQSKDESVIRRTNSKRMITLLVDEGQAQVLQLAVHHGHISLAMRNPLDDSPLSVADATMLSELTEKFMKHIPVTQPSQDLGSPLVADTIANEAVASGGTQAAPEPAASNAAAEATRAIEQTDVIGTTVIEAKPAAEQWIIEIMRGRRTESKTFEIRPIKTSDASDAG